MNSLECKYNYWLIWRRRFDRSNSSAGAKRTQFRVSLCSWGLIRFGLFESPEWTVQPVIRGTVGFSQRKRSLRLAVYHSFGMLQLSLKPLHTVTCGELWSGRPTTPCALSAACEGGVLICELCCYIVQKREEHITQCRSVLFWSSSLWKGLFGWKVSVLAVTSVTHYHTENKTTWFPPCSQYLYNDVNGDDMHCFLNVTEFQNQKLRYVCRCAKWEAHSSWETADSHTHNHIASLVYRKTTESV